MANQTEKLVLEISEPVAQKQGVYVVDVSYKKEKDGWFLRLFIDKEGGVGIDDCEAFSRAVEAELDRMDPIEGNYCLEVSSPGVERRLVKDREFAYYVGRKVDVKLYEPINEKKEFCGILTGYKDKTVTVSTEDGNIEFEKQQAVYVKLHFEW